MPAAIRIFTGTIGIGALAFVLPSEGLAQNRIGTGAVDGLYQQHCASCHGEGLAGGSAGSLIDGEWRYGSSDVALTRAIEAGIPEDGMPDFGSALTPEQIRSLVIYIREGKQLAARQSRERKTVSADTVFATEEVRFRLEKVADAPGILWSLAFLPAEMALVTQRDGALWLLEESKLRGPIEGTPDVRHQGQGGLLDVAPHPDYADNGWIYLSFSDRAEDDGGMTKVVRGRIKQMQWTDEEVIWEASEEYYLPTSHHFGSRFAFRDGYLFFSIGDRGRDTMAQDLSRPNGKVYRVHDDGRVPQDNPFSDRDDAIPGIWSYGHRNPQGLDRHPVTDEIWSTEHGPRGGDELNLIEPGINYGWPVITYGMNYDGSPITDKTAAPGMRQPKLYWTPSISPSGIVFYTGDSIEAWKHNLFATGLASEALHRIVIEDGEVVKDEIVLQDLGRIRDVANGPDGCLYLAIENNGSSKGSTLYRLVPANGAQRSDGSLTSHQPGTAGLHLLTRPR